MQACCFDKLAHVLTLFWTGDLSDMVWSTACTYLIIVVGCNGWVTGVLPCVYQDGASITTSHYKLSGAKHSFSRKCDSLS